MSSSETNANKAEERRDDECVICLGEIENRSTTDACMHYFCFACLQECVKIRTRCPLCKRVVSEIRYDIDKDGENTYKSFPIENSLIYVRRIRSSLNNLPQVISHRNSDTIRNARHLLQEIEDFSRQYPIPDISMFYRDCLLMYVNDLERQYAILRRSEEVLRMIIHRCSERMAFIGEMETIFDTLEEDENLSVAYQELLYGVSALRSYLTELSANSSEASLRLKDERQHVILCFFHIRTTVQILADLRDNSEKPLSASNVNDD